MLKKDSFSSEFKKQFRLALTAATGFIIAWAWKDYILRIIGTYFDQFRLLFPTASYLFTAVLITILGVGFIFLTSKMLD